MTRRQHYPYAASPYRQSSRNTTAFKLFPRSPVSSRAQLANRSRLQTTRTTNTNRFLRSRTRLDAIQEEQENDDRRQSRELYRQLDAYRDRSEAGYPEDEDDEMDWDETTLVAMLRDKSSDQQECDELAAIADQLKIMMSSRGPALKQYLANTVIPTASRLKEVHAVLEDEVDITFGKGLLNFDEISKRIEALALQDEDDTKAIFLDVKKNVENILDRLKAAEANRSQLWSDFERNINEHAGRVTNVVHSVSGHLEHTISYLEKRSQELDKDDGSLEKLKAVLLQKGLR